MEWLMTRWVVIGAGLDCSGTGRGEAEAPTALRDAGVVAALDARDAGDVPITVDDPTRDRATGIVAVEQLRTAAAAIRAGVADALRTGDRPLVLGGDCTILIGVAAAVRQEVGPFDLVFVDGHPDYLDGATSPTGESADMDLAIVTGHGPPGLVDLGGAPPLVHPADVVLVGHRAGELDADAAAERARLPDAVTQIDAPALAVAGGDAVGRRLAAGRTGPWWLHLDLDVLDDAALPAVTYPQPGGVGWDDITALLTALGMRRGLVGVSVADLRPDLDPDGRYARRTVTLLATAFAPPRDSDAARADAPDRAVADPPTMHAEQVARGRAAAQRRAWDTAFAAFAAADAAGALQAHDLQLWATAAYLLGRVDTAVDAQARAFQAHRENDDLAAAVRCGFWIAFILTTRGDVAQAAGWLARGRHLLEALPADSAEHGYLLCTTAFRLVTVEREYAEAQATADLAAEIGRRTRDEDLVALALNVAGRSAILDGRTAEGLSRLDEAMVAVVSGEVSPPVAGSVYCSLIEACEEIADLRRAREWTDALTRWCERQEGMVTFTGQCLTHRAAILRRGGDWRAAADQAVLACERFIGAADRVATGMALYELAEVRRLQGDLTAAEDAYRRAGEWGRDPQPGLALVRLVQGRAEAAAATMRRLLTERTDAIERVKLLPAHVETMLAVGDRSAAATAAAELADHAGTYGTDALHAAADHARGAVLLAEGDAGAAAVRLRSAQAAWRALDAPYEMARTRVLISLACRRLGDRETAELELDAARRAFTRLGAASDLAHLTAAHAEPVHGLTPRELEVLRLVATGMTNQAIADDLHVAVKTVDRHVASILAKLHVASRTAATAFAYERGLL